MRRITPIAAHTYLKTLLLNNLTTYCPIQKNKNRLKKHNDEYLSRTLLSFNTFCPCNHLQARNNYLIKRH